MALRYCLLGAPTALGQFVAAHGGRLWKAVKARLKRAQAAAAAKPSRVLLGANGFTLESREAPTTFGAWMIDDNLSFLGYRERFPEAAANAMIGWVNPASATQTASASGAATAAVSPVQPADNATSTTWSSAPPAGAASEFQAGPNSSSAIEPADLTPPAEEPAASVFASGSAGGGGGGGGGGSGGESPAGFSRSADQPAAGGAGSPIDSSQPIAPTASPTSAPPSSAPATVLSPSPPASQ